MRIVAEIPHPDFKITVFNWNERYLLKIEAGPFEQTYKIGQYDLDSEEDVKKILSPEFLQKALQIFLQMRDAFKESLKQLQNPDVGQ